ncbi:antibiotic biosynthesis monooxygenase [Planktotalea sp.]|uniref:putative quinol monooxygenase n=1 Tax=Planktotalea sp. TaxID=2029877 RepID=UPI0032998ADD
MLIAHVIFSVAPENRTSAIETLKQEVSAVRAMDGCIAFIPFLDATNQQDVGVLHEWASSDSFEAYIASDSFVSIGETLRPIMVTPPTSKRFDATINQN